MDNIKVVGEDEACYIRACQYSKSGQKIEAFKIFSELAESGHAEAQYSLAVMYDQGDGG